MRKTPSYHSVVSDISDTTDDETELSDTDTDIQITKNYKHKTFCQYLRGNTLSKGPFLYFSIGIIASIANALFYIMDNDSGFIISGVLGSSLCFYGVKHFYTLLGLKKAIDRLSQLNIHFQRERTKLSKSLNHISDARQNLQDTKTRLQAANAKNKQNLENFRETQTNMESFGKESVKELTNLHKKSDVIQRKWRESLYEYERELLHAVFERVERQGSRYGMNINEFKEFTNQLPSNYKRRFDRLGTFHTLSKGGSLIKYDDFKVSLDLFAEMKVDNVDIEFEFRRTKQKLSEETEPEEWKQNRIKTIGLTKLNEAQSIDLEFDEDEANVSDLYDRSIVITKRTIRGEQMKEDLDLDQDDDDDDDDDLMHGIRLKKHHYKVTSFHWE